MSTPSFDRYHFLLQLFAAMAVCFGIIFAFYLWWQPGQIDKRQVTVIEEERSFPLPAGPRKETPRPQ